MVPGIEMVLGGGATYVVPPLSLGAIEVLLPKLQKLSGTNDDVPIMSLAVVAALRRNYPDLTRAQILGSLTIDETTGDITGEPGLVGLECMQAVFDAVMDVSGLRRKALEAEADDAGKA